MSVYILEFDAWDGSQVVTKQFATHGRFSRASDVPANTFYDGRIVDVGVFRRSIFDGGDVLGVPEAGRGAIILNNQDGALDYLYDYGLDGRAFTLSEVAVGAELSAKTVLATGVLDGIDAADAFATIRLRIRDPRAVLDTALLTERYAGTSTGAELGVEGETDLVDQLKPLVLGKAPNVQATLVNQYDRIFQVSVRAVASLTVYDGGNALVNEGDVATLAALQSASPSAGAYITCKVLGLFQVASAPVYSITADVVEGSTLADRSTARVVQRLLDILDDPSIVIDTNSFDALHAAAPAEVGTYVSSGASALSIIGDLLQSVGAALVPTNTGTLKVARIAEPASAPVATFTLRHITAESSLTLNKGPAKGGVPAWSVTLNWGRIWVRQDATQVAGVVTDARKAYLATEWRQATKTDSAVQTAHLSAAEIEIDTALTTQADAEAEAIRRLALHATRRDHLTIAVHRDHASGIVLGDTIAVDVDRRFGFPSGGKRLLVVGIEDDWTKRIVRLTGWG